MPRGVRAEAPWLPSPTDAIGRAGARRVRRRSSSRQADRTRVSVMTHMFAPSLVIPAQAGIQKSFGPGPRPAPGRRLADTTLADDDAPGQAADRNVHDLRVGRGIDHRDRVRAPVGDIELATVGR